MREFDYLTLENVEYLHILALQEYRGFPGRETGKLEGILGILMTGFADFEKYPSVKEKAAAYYYFLASGHAFLDGNKRTSFVVASTFLDWNGYDIIVPNDEVFDFTMKIANDKTRPQFELVVEWIREFMVEQEEVE